MSSYDYRFWHKFECGHTQRTNNYSTWQWMRGQSLCKSCNEERDVSNVPQYSAPPLGLRPTGVWEQAVIQQRGVEISEAIGRYMAVGKVIPKAWIKELNQLNRKLHVEPALAPQTGV